MLTVTLKPDVAEQIEHLAGQTQIDADALVDQALRTYLTEVHREKIQAETRAFRQQFKTILQQYRGEYVAVHEGQVIDHDLDLRTLHLRVFARLGRAPVLLKKVEESEREWLFRSPRVARGRP